MIFNAISAFVLTVLPLAYVQDNDINAMLQDLNNGKIIPDVVPPFTPQLPLEVVFTDSAGSTFPVTAGANLTTSGTCVHELVQRTVADNPYRDRPCPVDSAQVERH